MYLVSRIIVGVFEDYKIIFIRQISTEVTYNNAADSGIKGLDRIGVLSNYQIPSCRDGRIGREVKIYPSPYLPVGKIYRRAAFVIKLDPGCRRFRCYAGMIHDFVNNNFITEIESVCEPLRYKIRI